VLALPPVAAPLVVGSVAGVEALGAFRLLQVLFGPVMLIFQSWYVARIGVLVRAAPDGQALRRSVLVPGAAIGALSLSLGAVLLLLPPGASKHLGGASFSQASPAVLPFALATGAEGVASALVAGLRSLGRSNRVVQIRLPYAAVALAAVWLGVRTGGVSGASWGLAIAQVISCVVFARYLDAKRSARSVGTEIPNLGET
jgi:O-antigen/teichoic acid export membrane protein